MNVKQREILPHEIPDPSPSHDTVKDSDTMTLSASSTSPEALAAAAWAVDHPNFRQLISGYRARQIPTMKDGYRADDNTVADEWLINQWKQAN